MLISGVDFSDSSLPEGFKSKVSLHGTIHKTKIEIKSWDRKPSVHLLSWTPGLCQTLMESKCLQLRHKTVRFREDKLENTIHRKASVFVSNRPWFNPGAVDVSLWMGRAISMLWNPGLTLWLALTNRRRVEIILCNFWASDSSFPPLHF